jgi:hypothetical protein
MLWTLRKHQKHRLAAQKRTIAGNELLRADRPKLPDGGQHAHKLLCMIRSEVK